MASTVPRVVVLGGGIAGCSAAAHLSRQGAQVTLVEMGRALGGRATTRHSREDKRIEIDHGAPVAEISTPEGLKMVQDLADKGFVEEFSGVYAKLESEGKATILNGEDLPADTKRFVGKPRMSRWCEGLMHGANVKTIFNTMVYSFEAIRATDGAIIGWQLSDKEKTLICESDWVVISSSAVAHTRWGRLFGGAPPIAETAVDIKDKKLTSAVIAIEAMGSSPVHVALFGFEGEAAAAWAKLPFAILKTDGDSTLTKVLIQKRNDMVFVVVHSTHEFAEANLSSYGHKSAFAQNNGKPSDSETHVLRELMEGLERVMKGFAVSSLSEAVYGPVLHRWGSAFPLPASIISPEDVFAPAARIVFTGDYVGRPVGNIEAALLSGATASNLLMSDWNATSSQS